jgi:hypothetical protein
VTRNALDEVFGGSGDFTLSSGTVRIGLPHSEGGRQLYVVRPSAGGCTVTLPVAVFLPKPSAYVVVNLGSQSIDVVLSILGTTVVTIPAGQQAELFLLNDAFPWGTWQARLATVTAGTLLAERTPVYLEIGAGAFGPVDLRKMAIEQGATSESSPYSVQCRIRSGALIGSESTSSPALMTGDWPTGSTLLLIIEDGGIVSGKGGDGGIGGNLIPGPGTTATNGGNGGPALMTTMATTIVNRGTIQGGGGGGGGAAANGGIGGGGGGSGAGWTRSPGGRGGFGGNSGGDGTVTSGGFGGAGPSAGFGGGNGGFPGLSGLSPASGGTGGTNGFGIIRYTGVPFTYIAPLMTAGAPYLLGGTQVL